MRTRGSLATPRDGDIVVWSTAVIEGRYLVTGWRPQSGLLFSTHDMAVSAPRSLAQGLVTDAWSTTDGVTFRLIAGHRRDDEAVRIA